jgi:uncharacterized protein
MAREASRAKLHPMSMAPVVLLVIMLLGNAAALAAGPLPRIFVYTCNGVTLEGKKGYVHDNIASSVAALRQLGAENGFAVDVSDNPDAFTAANLAQYRALVFTNTNNQILRTAAQQEALQGYIRGGGGFVGIHSAVGSMRAWPWFWSLIGGSFVRHPKLQEFTVRVVDPRHPSTEFMDASFRWQDEFYYLRDMPSDLRVLLAGELATLDDPQKPKGETTRPLAWCHAFEGGRAWTTTLGHRKEHYADPFFQRHLLGGIRWAMGITQ